MNYVKKIYLATIFLFLYAPIGVLIAQSFNASRYRGHRTGLTLDRYTNAFIVLNMLLTTAFDPLKEEGDAA